MVRTSVHGTKSISGCETEMCCWSRSATSYSGSPICTTWNWFKHSRISQFLKKEKCKLTLYLTGIEQFVLCEAKKCTAKTLDANMNITCADKQGQNRWPFSRFSWLQSLPTSHVGWPWGVRLPFPGRRCSAWTQMSPGWAYMYPYPSGLHQALWHSPPAHYTRI